MEEIYELLKKAGTYFIATCEGNQPRVRPFGTIHIYDGRLYFQTGKVKAVSRQLHANPKVELCAMVDGNWLRVEGTAVEDDDREAPRQYAGRVSLTSENVLPRRREHRGLVPQKCHRSALLLHGAAQDLQVLIQIC